MNPSLFLKPSGLYGLFLSKVFVNIIIFNSRIVKWYVPLYIYLKMSSEFSEATKCICIEIAEISDSCSAIYINKQKILPGSSVSAFKLEFFIVLVFMVKSIYGEPF